jgi:hypothetical protein
VTDAESTPITGTGELTTNDGDDGTYATPNNDLWGPGGVGRTGLAGSGRGPGRPDGSDQHPYRGRCHMVGGQS